MSQALNAPARFDSGVSAGSSHRVEKPKSKGPRLYRQNSPIARARGRQETQFISGFDGSVDGHSSADGEGEASSALETDSPKTSIDDDDEYRLSGSENNKDDSEQSILDDMRSLSPTTTKKKPGKMRYSSKPRGKPAAKAKAVPITAKKINRPVTNKATAPTQIRPVAPNGVIQSSERLSISPHELSPTRQNMKDSVGSGSKRKRRDVIPDSQEFVTDSQKTARPLSPKGKVMIKRRAKSPFYKDNLGAHQTTSGPTASVCITADTRQQLAAVGQGNVSPADNTELQECEEVHFINQIKQTAPKACRSEGTRPKGKDCVQPQVDKGKGRAIDQIQPLPTAYQIDSPPINQLSDQYSELVDTEYVDMRLQNSPSRSAEAKPGKTLGSSEPHELPVNEIEVTPVIKKGFKHVDFSTQAHSFGPIRVGNVGKTKNEATQANIFGAQPSLQNVYYREEFEEGATGDSTTKPWVLRSPRVQGESRPSRGNPIAAEVRRECGQAEKLEKDRSTKIPRDLSNMATPLHPTSRAWAQRIAKKSRQNNLKVSAQADAGETEPLGRSPRTILESQKIAISKRETALGDQRNAIVDSIQEITMAVLQHLKTKESAIDSIVGIYQQSGHQILDMLLDRQSNELRQTASDFDGKCMRLENLFQESARHAEAIDKKMSNENNWHLGDWARRSKELKETIKLAKDAIASI
ncbi:hypothetical protein F4803DRAFT_576828 [Xylaria telfairii]|nr:hypothetical protein F4803DRAFT_576828 [Xylaria telfairii]